MNSFLLMLLSLVIMLLGGWIIWRYYNQKPQELVVHKDKEEIPPANARSYHTSSNLPNRFEKYWDFLARITQIVKQTFSPKEQETVLKLGKELVGQGMKYQHVMQRERLSRATMKTQQKQIEKQ